MTSDPGNGDYYLHTTISKARYHALPCSGDLSQLIKLLAAAGADLAAQDEDGDTALHIAVKKNHINSVFALLEAGAPIGVVNAAGRTAQDEARSRGQGHLVTLLQKYSK